MGKLSVEGFFTPSNCGGYKHHNNPQVELIVKKRCSLTLDLSVDGLDNVGIVFMVFKTEEKGRIFITEMDKKVDESEYFFGNSVTLHTILDPGRYVCLLCLQKKGLFGEFTFSVEHAETNSVVSKFFVLDKPYRKKLYGGFSFFHGGHFSIRNPQFVLKVKKSCFVNIVVEDRNKNHPISLFITSAPRKESRRKKRNCGRIFSKTDSVLMPSFEHLHYFEASESAYLIVICGEKRSVRFNVTIETSSFENIKHFGETDNRTEDIEEMGREDHKCHEILKKSKFPLFCLTNPIDDIIRYCNSHDTTFQDGDFLPCDDSINKYNGPRLDEEEWPEIVLENNRVCEWKRVSSFLDTPELFVDGIDPDDFIQGEIGDSFLISGFSSICTNPNFAHRNIFPKQYNDCGVYVFRMFHRGQFKYVVVDSYLPVAKSALNSSTFEFIFGRGRDINEIYIPLFEKAFAKIAGSYRMLKFKSPREVLRTLSGGETVLQTHAASSLAEEHWDVMMSTSTAGNYMCSTTASRGPNNEELSNFGLLQNYCYSLLSVVQLDDGVRLVKLRNPRGTDEWNGDFGDDDVANWTPERQVQVKFLCRDDGIFYMKFDDFRHFFKNTWLCENIKSQYPFEVKVVDDWASNWSCPGLGPLVRSRNPKLKLVVDHDNTKLVLYFRRMPIDKDEDKDREDKIENKITFIRFFMYSGSIEKMPLTRALPADQLVYDSGRLVQTDSFRFEFHAEKKGEYVLIPTVSKRVKGDRFSVKVMADKSLQLFAPDEVDLVPYRAPVKKGRWTSYGYMSIRNPKFKIWTKVRGKTRVLVILRRMDKRKQMGMVIALLPPGYDCAHAMGGARDQIARSRVLFSSDYRVSKDISIEFQLDHVAEPYILTFFTDRKFAKLKYRMEIRSNNKIELGRRFT